MKKLCLLLVMVLFFVGCDDNSIPEPIYIDSIVECAVIEGNEENSIFGTWKLAEFFVHDVTRGEVDNNGNLIRVVKWTEAKNNSYLLIIKPDGTFSSTQLIKTYPNCTTGTATMTADLINFKYDCSETGISPNRYSYKFVDKKLELIGYIPFAYVGDGERFCKQALIN